MVTIKTSRAYSLATTYNLHDIIREGRGARQTWSSHTTL
ncbi:MAG: hypothetical protein AVDCRST_MAG86-1805 [uncultured Truepera sp.]|uniref:Uncharacterized protein n=1 Tax=uncultured Truepera sp. TaxID=543023 RepID=A0A6J4VDB9_9DEIN|nr:MAG: hypothetical protein AVDCRST_MAG86-1805 [uncultured Truepera sp.]